MAFVYFWFLLFPTPQRYKNNTDEKRICNIFFFRQFILCCQSKNKFSLFRVYNEEDKLNLLENQIS